MSLRSIIFILPVLVFGQDKSVEGNPSVILTSGEMDKRRGCWVTLFEKMNYQGSDYVLFSDSQIPELDYSTGPASGESLKSMTVGSTASASLYPEINFHGKKLTVVGPKKLSPLPFEVKSLKLKCIPVKAM